MSARSRSSGVAAALACVLTLAACGDETPPRPPASFNRPNRVAFFCVRRSDSTVAPASECESTSSNRESFALHALVTQSSRGEVAAVDLDFGFVLDSRRDIPGYTFVPVGELPSAILVPPQHPEHTYVANFGSRDIHVLRTQAFLSLAPGENPIEQVIPLAGSASQGSPADMVLAPSEDALYVAAPGDGAVWRLPLERCEDDAAGCEEGLVRTADIERIDLRASAGLMQAPMSVQPTERYERMCGFTRPTPPTIEQPEVDVDALAAPRPVALTLDAFCEGRDDCVPRLLVADEAQPFIHTIELGADGGLSAPLVTGVPTRAVVVTPPVPVSLEQRDERTQYVYAIDATDGSVLALENGQIVSIDADPNGRADRVPLGPSAVGEAGAVVIDVLSPAYDYASSDPFVRTPDIDVEMQCDDPQPDVENFSEHDDGQCLDCDHLVQDPRRLRGVFLAVALSDSTLRIIDVHDMELDQGESTSCRTCPPSPVPVVARHHPRLESNFISQDPEITFKLVPRLGDGRIRGVTTERRLVSIRPDGTTGSPQVPGLDCIACASELQQVFPGPEVQDESESEGSDAGTADAGVVEVERCPAGTPALVCAAADPWMALQEVWAVTYEGPIPGARVGRGELIPFDQEAGDTGKAQSRTGRTELTGDVDFCSLGVLGKEDDPAQDPGEEDEGKWLGDQAIFVSEVLPEASIDPDDREMCAELKELREEGGIAALPVRRAYRDRLVVGHALIEQLGRVSDYRHLSACFGDHDLQFVVHVRNAYTVIGSRSGFVHDVAAAPDGRCTPAGGKDAPRGRAYGGRTFRNGRIELRPRLPEGDEPPSLGAGVQMDMAGSADKVVFYADRVSPFSTANVLPVELRYNPLDRRLYLVDIHSRGLVPISLDPFPDRSGFQFD